ncbi:MAG: hypothetical protein RIS47_1509 [Bacteroidota bacterium]|jgi:hypothetical protein
MSIHWGTQHIDDSEHLEIQFGTHQLIIRTFEEGLQIQHSQQDEKQHSSTLKAGHGPTHHNADSYAKYFSTEQNNIEIEPHFPGKPVIIKPEKTYKLLPKQQLNTYVTIPLCLHIYTHGRKGLLLETYGDENLPDAWFGDENGEACYWHETTFDFRKQIQTPNPGTIYCPVNFTNLSDEVLEIEKFLLQQEYLNIYQIGEMITTDKLSIRFRGLGNESIVSVDKPTPTDQYQLLTEAAKNNVSQLIKKSFDFFKSIY